MRMPINVWITKYNSDFEMGKRQAKMILWVVKRSIRPSDEDFRVFTMIRQMLPNDVNLT